MRLLLRQSLQQWLQHAAIVPEQPVGQALAADTARAVPHPVAVLPHLSQQQLQRGVQAVVLEQE